MTGRPKEPYSIFRRSGVLHQFLATIENGGQKDDYAEEDERPDRGAFSLWLWLRSPNPHCCPRGRTKDVVVGHFSCPRNNESAVSSRCRPFVSLWCSQERGRSRGPSAKASYSSSLEQRRCHVTNVIQGQKSRVLRAEQGGD
eukprot:3462001-Rhodomonas_salina.1